MRDASGGHLLAWLALAAVIAAAGALAALFAVRVRAARAEALRSVDARKVRHLVASGRLAYSPSALEREAGAWAASRVVRRPGFRAALLLPAAFVVALFSCRADAVAVIVAFCAVFLWFAAFSPYTYAAAAQRWEQAVVQARVLWQPVQDDAAVLLPDQLRRLKELHDAGALSDAEFAEAKRRLLA